MFFAAVIAYFLPEPRAEIPLQFGSACWVTLPTPAGCRAASAC